MEVYSNGLKKSFSIDWPFCFIDIMGEKNNQWWGWGLDKEILGSFSDYLSLMFGKPRIRLNNLTTSLRFLCLGLNPIIDSISPAYGLKQLTQDTKSVVRCYRYHICTVTKIPNDVWSWPKKKVNNRNIVVTTTIFMIIVKKNNHRSGMQAEKSQTLRLKDNAWNSVNPISCIKYLFTLGLGFFNLHQRQTIP